MILPQALNNALYIGTGGGGNIYEQVLIQGDLLIEEEVYEIIIEHCGTCYD